MIAEFKAIFQRFYHCRLGQAYLKRYRRPWYAWLLRCRAARIRVRQAQKRQVPGGVAQAPTAPEDQNPYWPLKQGNTWRYVESAGTDEKQLKGNEESIMTVSKVDSDPGHGSLVSISITLKGHVAGTEQYLLDAGQKHPATGAK